MFHPAQQSEKKQETSTSDCFNKIVTVEDTLRHALLKRSVIQLGKKKY